jgi:hypothetical protein
MPKCKPKYQSTDCGTCGKRIEKSVIIIHAEKYFLNLPAPDLLGFLANLDNVTVDVADFEELRVAAVLNRPGEHAAALELLVPFL